MKEVVSGGGGVVVFFFFFFPGHVITLTLIRLSNAKSYTINQHRVKLVQRVKTKLKYNNKKKRKMSNFKKVSKSKVIVVLKLTSLTINI